MLRQDPTLDHAPLRVLSWNILEGFHLPRGRNREGPPTLDPDRLAAAQTVLATIRPDVVVFNEALWAAEYEGYAMDYARAFGYPYAVGDLYDGCWGNLVMSRYPIVAHHRFRIYNRGGLRASIQTPSWGVEVATYHPHPDRRPAKKAEDFVDLITRQSTDHPFLLCGDFNAISPEDQPDLPQLTEAFRRFAHDPAHSARRFIESGTAIFGVLATHGLRDAFAPDQRQPTIPSDLLSTDKASAMRIDHLWVNAQIQVDRAAVIQSPAAHAASDHLPLCVDLRPAGPQQTAART